LQGGRISLQFSAATYILVSVHPLLVLNRSNKIGNIAYHSWHIEITFCDMYLGSNKWFIIIYYYCMWKIVTKFLSDTDCVELILKHALVGREIVSLNGSCGSSKVLKTVSWCSKIKWKIVTNLEFYSAFKFNFYLIFVMNTTQFWSFCSFSNCCLSSENKILITEY
jgi:hypothetical protein